VIRTLDDRIGRLASRWVEAVQRRAGPVVLLFLLASLGLGAIAARHLGLDSDEDALFSEDVPFAVARREFYDAFPTLVDPLVVVVDAPTRDQADVTAQQLATALRARPDSFRRVYRPGGGPFFERYGLLYLEREKLEDLVEHLITVQPYLAELSRDPSLAGFLELLADASRAAARDELGGVDLTDVYERVGQAMAARLDGRPTPLSWADVILGGSATPQERRRYLLVQPRPDAGLTTPGEAALLELGRVVEDLGLERDGVRVRTTGVLALAHDEMQRVSVQSALAGLASFVLVALALQLALRSTRMILAALATLLVGLVLTAAFAALVVGHLNLISVTFGVLFIGLSIDFAIHLCLAFGEGLHRGLPSRRALPQAAGSVGGALVVCATTTALGFFAFVATDYRGVAELGLIAGAGMFVSLLTNLTLLPALLALGLAPRRPRSLAWRGTGLLALPVRRPGAVLGITAALVAGALLLAPRIGFDANPLRVRDPHTESVQVFEEMLADGEAFPWNLNVLGRDLESARTLAERLERLPEVDHTLTLSDYVPDEQTTRLEILGEADFLLGPTLEVPDAVASHPPARTRAALEAVVSDLRRLETRDGPRKRRRAATALRETLERLRERLEERPDAAPAVLASLEEDLLGSLPVQLRRLRTALDAGPVRLDDLPAEILEQYVATDGRVRVEVFPRGDLTDDAALGRYVAAVQSVAPEAFGEGYVILESGRTVVRALGRALALASVGIGLVLLVLWRDPRDALLAAAPLVLATLLTAAATVAFSTPFNFANVIVVPLLLGMGVDSGVHLMHRYRSERAPGNLLGTTTARAVLWSALTTIASFGTLGFSTHVGLASLGRLLTVGIAFIVVCNLLVLPALLTVVRRR
jgi:hopanoid biosynthesis associated RND transporter like protein HpnN